MMALLLVRVGVPFNLKLIIMAKVYTNDKNFLVIEMNGAEASGLGFGIDIPQEFSTTSFFDFIFKTMNFDISSYVEEDYHDHEYFDILEDIYTQIKSNI